MSGLPVNHEAAGGKGSISKQASFNECNEFTPCLDVYEPWSNLLAGWLFLALLMTPPLKLQMSVLLLVSAFPGFLSIILTSSGQCLFNYTWHIPNSKTGNKGN